MSLIKTSFFTSISFAIKICSLFIINKIAAIYVGPAGLALVGQFYDFSQFTQSLASGAINQGLVKFVAEYRQDIGHKKKILSAALIISLICSIISGIFLFAARHFLAVKLLRDDSFSSIFVVFAFTITFFSLNTFLLSVLNGERDIKKYTLANIASSFSGLILSSFLVIYYRIYGALLALVLYQSIVFFITLFFVIKSHWFKLSNFFAGVNKKYAFLLFQYSIMTIVTMFITPVAQIIVRNNIANYLSWDNAGYWQAITKISDGYLLLITSTLMVHYLPKLSELKNNILLKKEIMYAYKMIMPVITLLAVLIFLLRYQVINILFTDKFLPIAVLFKYQLLGDVIKIASWLLSYLLLAKAMIKTYIVTEVIFCTSYVVFSIIGLHFFGLRGVIIAFVFNYCLYLLTMFLIYKRWIITNEYAEK